MNVGRQILFGNLYTVFSNIYFSASVKNNHLGTRIVFKSNETKDLHTRSEHIFNY